ncbi:MAG: DUF4860 domain-containing protein [Lachnospiraceae bacterium]|nr:DUF4860 domain-containing protein [Lachnospiraceae bacterium]MCI9059332.1 DUF4860 domain-containing protein [Lachnospiraceae bacterium]
MQNKTQRSHMVDFLFPVALLFVFALSALAVILLATEVYRSTTENSSLNYTARTSLSYISEKIHQNDAEGDVSIGTFDGCDALILQHNYNGSVYKTYIYVYENELKELFVKDGLEFTASMGKSILSVEDFSMRPLKDRMFQFSCTDADGQEASTVVGIRSGGIL